MSKPLMLLMAVTPLLATAAEPNIVEVRKGDVLIVEETKQPPPERSPIRAPDRPVPTRGMDMANVRNVFGEPETVHPAVGEPPITRWDYDGYSVFFEHDKVLHSVVTE